MNTLMEFGWIPFAVVAFLFVMRKPRTTMVMAPFAIGYYCACAIVFFMSEMVLSALISLGMVAALIYAYAICDQEVSSESRGWEWDGK